MFHLLCNTRSTSDMILMCWMTRKNPPKIFIQHVPRDPLPPSQKVLVPSKHIKIYKGVSNHPLGGYIDLTSVHLVTLRPVLKHSGQADACVAVCVACFH